MMIFFDKEGNIISCNAKAMQELGYGEEIYGYRINQIFQNSFQYEGKKLIVLQDKSDEFVDTIAYRKNQTCFPVKMNIYVRYHKNKYYGLCLVINTENIVEANRKIEQLQSELDMQSKKRSEITANVTHELRTPVNAIMGLSDNLLDMDLNAEQTEVVRLIKHCCNNMNAMINNFLDYAKITSEKMVLEQREFNLIACIDTIIESNKPKLTYKGLQLLVNISDDIPKMVVGDELRLTQILNNLLSNAVKFTMMGQVALEIVKLSETERHVELFFMVMDTGIGISDQDKDKLFQNFSQVDGFITRRFGGTGLGLAISKRLVEAMGGSIGLQSEEGKGSTFSFTVRLALPTGDGEVDNRNNRQPDISYDVTHPDVEVIHSEAIETQREKAKNYWPDDAFKKQFALSIEKLSLCIEMDNWYKAEELAYQLKKQIPSEQSDLHKKAFHLLLAVRKEKRDVAFSIIDELKTYIDER
jgi:signal transduction histidine kinase